MSDIDYLQWCVTLFNGLTVGTLAVSFLLGAVSFFANKRLGELKDAKAAKEQQESNERIADLDAKRIEAERDLAAIKERMKYRALTVEQKEAIRDKLKEMPRGQISIECLGGDDESQTYTNDFVGLFEEFGWEVTRGHLLAVTEQRGVWFLVRSKETTPEWARILFGTLEGVDVKPHLGFVPTMDPDRVTLRIGLKPVDISN